MAITIPIVSTWDGKGVDRSLRDIEKAQGGWAKAGKSIEALTPLAAAAGAAVVAGAAVAVKAASDQEQAFGGLEAVFKTNAAAMESWAKSMAGVGINATDAANAAVKMGASLKNAGLDTQAAADQSQKLVELGADLAATFGGSATDAVDALGAALRGETDPIERYGVSIKQADVNAKMAADGTDKLTGAAAKNAEMMARLELITQQTADAQGRAGQEAGGTFAGAMAAAQASVTNLAADLGKQLLPYVTQFVGWLQQGVDWLGKHQGAVTALVAVVGGFSAAVLAANLAMKAYQAYLVAVKVATLAWRAAQVVLNLVLSANPIGLIITAIAALAAGIVYAYNHSETFRRIVQQVWNAIKQAASFIAGQAVAAWHGFTAAIQNVVNWFKQLWQWVQNVWSRINAFLSGPINAIKSAAGFLGGLFRDANLSATIGFDDARSAQPRLAAGVMGRAITTVGGGSTVINFTAAGYNPQREAQYLRGVLSGAEVRTGFRGVRA